MRVADGLKPSIYISSSDLIRPPLLIPGPPVLIVLPPLSALALMRWRTACLCPHTAADRAMRRRTVGEVMADVYEAIMRRRTVTARVPGGENADLSLGESVSKKRRGLRSERNGMNCEHCTLNLLFNIMP